MRSLHLQRVGRWAGALTIGVLVAVGSIQTVGAHAHVIDSDPKPGSVLAASPPELTLHFDSPIADMGNRIVLYRSDRSTVNGLAPRIVPGRSPSLRTRLPDLVPGIYTVAWTSVSADDGHSLSQFFAFTVGPEPQALLSTTIPPLKVGDTTVALQFSRGDAGPTSIQASVVDSLGKPVSRLQCVIIRYKPVGLDVGEDEVVANATGNQARTPAFTLGLSGPWQLTVIVRRVGLDDVTATTTHLVAPAPSVVSEAARASEGPTATPGAVSNSAKSSPTTSSSPTSASSPAPATRTPVPVLALPPSATVDANVARLPPSTTLADDRFFIPVVAAVALAVLSAAFAISDAIRRR